MAIGDFEPLGESNPLVKNYTENSIQPKLKSGRIAGNDFFGEDTYDRYNIENWTSISSKNPAIQSLAPLVLVKAG